MPMNLAEATSPVAVLDLVECYRCACPGRPDRLERDGWVSLHDCSDDGASLFVCPDCQSEREQEARELLLLFD
jgi:hypothetical protein